LVLLYHQVTEHRSYLFVFQITQHLAANEQNILVPWIKTFPKKMVDRVPTYLWPFGTMGIVYVIVAYTESVDHAENYAHRF
jgi:hypothetical protein